MKTPIDIPSGLDHLRMLSDCETVTLLESSKDIGEMSTDRRMIGTALSAIYQAATCHRQCYTGPHILEALWRPDIQSWRCCLYSDVARSLRRGT